jgi:tetratricopeptide (TPR) repeat protein
VQARRIALERNRANQEAETARQVSSFLVSLFEASKPGTRSPDSLTARELLDAGAERVDRELGDQPLVRATLHMTIGEAYSSLGVYPKAATQYETALALRRQVLGPNHPDLAASLSAAAESRDSVSERERLLREALALQQGSRGVDPDDLTRTLVRLAGVLRAQGRHAEAEGHAREGLRAAQSTHGQPHAVVALAWKELGKVLFESGRPAEARDAFQAALENALAVYGPSHRTTLDGRKQLATAQLGLEMYAEAEAAYRDHSGRAKFAYIEGSLKVIVAPPSNWADQRNAAIWKQKK